MTINTMTIKLFGKRETLYRVMNGAQGVVHVAASKQEAEQWIKDHQ